MWDSGGRKGGGRLSEHLRVLILLRERLRLPTERVCGGGAAVRAAPKAPTQRPHRRGARRGRSDRAAGAQSRRCEGRRGPTFWGRVTDRLGPASCGPSAMRAAPQAPPQASASLTPSLAKLYCLLLLLLLLSSFMQLRVHILLREHLRVRPVLSEPRRMHLSHTLSLDSGELSEPGSFCCTNSCEFEKNYSATIAGGILESNAIVLRKLRLCH